MKTENFQKAKMIMDKIYSLESKIKSIEYFRSKDARKNAHSLNHKILVKFDGPSEGNKIDEWMSQEYMSNLLVSFIQVHFLREMKKGLKELQLELSKLM